MKSFTIKYPLLILCIGLVLSLQSCYPKPYSKPNYVRLVDDNVKNIKTFIYEVNKGSYASISQNYQAFSFSFTKTNTLSDEINITITTELSIKNPKLSDELYFLSGTAQQKFIMTNAHLVEINENKVHNNTYTTYQNTTSHIPVTSTIQKTVNNIPVTETKTVLQQVNNSVPIQNTNQTVTNHHAYFIKNRITLNKSNLEDICKNKTFQIRIYNVENDFWTLSFTPQDIIELQMLLQNQIRPQNFHTK